MGRARELSYQFPDMAGHATPHDGFVMHVLTFSPCPMLPPSLGYCTYSVVPLIYHTFFPLNSQSITT